MMWLAASQSAGRDQPRVGPAVAFRMRPAAAAILLTGLALTVSLVTGLVLCVAGCLAVAEVVPGLRPHDWALAPLRQSVPVPPAVGLVAGSVGAALLLWAVVHLSSTGGQRPAHRGSADIAECATVWRSSTMTPGTRTPCRDATRIIVARRDCCAR